MMNYDSRFSYILTIAVMDNRQITSKSDEMRHMETSLSKSKLTATMMKPVRLDYMS